MIVRDEERNMPTCLESAKHLVDAIAIVDTGSKDGTIAFIRDFMKKNKIPGEVIEEEWQGFYENRSSAVKHAQKVCDKIDSKSVWYFYFMDADDILMGNVEGKAEGKFQIDKKALTYDCYHVTKFVGNPDEPTYFPYPCLVRYESWNDKKRWAYTKSRRHEIPQAIDFSPSSANFTTGLHYARICGYRSTQHLRFLTDASECLKDYVDGKFKEARWAYYSANSFRDSGFMQLAIPLYKEAIELNRYHDDSYSACITMIRQYLINYMNCVKELKPKYEKKIIRWASEACEIRPKRLEAPYFMIKLYRLKSYHNQGYNIGRAYIGNKDASGNLLDSYITYIGFYDETGICAYYSGEIGIAISLFDKALKAKNISLKDSKRISYNLKLLMDSKARKIVDKVKLIEEGDNLPEELADDVREVETQILREFNNRDYNEVMAICGENIDRNGLKWLSPRSIYTYALSLKKLGNFKDDDNHPIDGQKKYEDLIEYMLQNISMVPEFASIVLEDYQLRFKGKYDAYSEYSKKIVDKLPYEVIGVKNVIVAFTGTSNVERTKITINSFLSCCKDLEKVDQFVFVDEGTTEEMTKEMKKLYPFVTLISKSKKDKGQAESMEILRNMDAKYILHIPVDWQFYVPGEYITYSLDVLASNANIGQVMMNLNYANVNSDYISKGGAECFTSSGKRYLLHKHGASGTTHGHWPHFSTHPAMNTMKSWKATGTFKVTEPFETTYAKRYTASGFHTAFLPVIHCANIDKAGAEIVIENNKEEESEKNKEGELDEDKEKNDKISPTEGQAELKDSNSLRSSELTTKLKTFVVNLDRRPDRWEKVKNLLSPHIPNAIRFSAFDGKNTPVKGEERKWVEKNEYNSKAGVVGCALSHIRLWKALSEDCDNTHYCVLEDDIELSNKFGRKFKTIEKSLDGSKDIVWLGYLLGKQLQDPQLEKMKQYSSTNAKVSRMPIRTANFLNSFIIGGTHGYIISKNCATRFMEEINSSGMSRPVDAWMFDRQTSYSYWECIPHIVIADWVDFSSSDNSKVDSDIQRDIAPAKFI